MACERTDHFRRCNLYKGLQVNTRSTGVFSVKSVLLVQTYCGISPQIKQSIQTCYVHVFVWCKTHSSVFVLKILTIVWRKQPRSLTRCSAQAEYRFPYQIFPLTDFRPVSAVGSVPNSRALNGRKQNENIILRMKMTVCTSETYERKSGRNKSLRQIENAYSSTIVVVSFVILVYSYILFALS